MKQYTPSQNVPAAVVTYSGSFHNQQPILFSTQYGQTGEYIIKDVNNPKNSKTQTVKLNWAIKRVDVTITRDWGTSQAFITLVCPLHNNDDLFPPLPDIHNYRGGNNPYLTCEDEIRIYAGYIDSPHTPITASMLDELPVSYRDLDNVTHKHDPNKPLAPIFWGFIDKVEVSGDARGVQMLISCRDRTRIFSDTRMLSIPSFQGTEGKEGLTGDDLTDSGVGNGDRVSILMQLAQGAAGNTTGETLTSCGGWKGIIEGPRTVRGFIQGNSAKPDKETKPKAKGNSIVSTVAGVSQTAVNVGNSPYFTNPIGASNPIIGIGLNIDNQIIQNIAGNSTNKGVLGTVQSAVSGTTQAAGSVYQAAVDKAAGVDKSKTTTDATTTEDESDSSLHHVVPQEDPAAWMREQTLRLMADKATPRFNIWVERPPIKKGLPNATYQIINKSPIEVVDHLSKTEERPMDFFSSHVNGDFVFGPRAIDFSGFSDPDRNYRTYFFKSYPRNKNNQAPPNHNQVIISMRSVTSTLATFNKFIVVDSTTKSAGVGLLGNIRNGVFSMPWSLENRSPTPPSRTQIIYDGALGTYDNPQAGSVIIGLAAARIWSRDLNGVQITLIGDPTFYPGEAIRVYNTLLHDYSVVTIQDPTTALKTENDIRNQADSIAASTYKTTQEQKADACQSEAVNAAAETLFNRNPGRIPSNLQNYIIPVYKVRSIQHKITGMGSEARGFTTIIAGVADF